MTLRIRSFIVTLLIAGSLVGALFVIARQVLLRDLEQVEKQYAIESTQRAIQMINSILDEMEKLTIDYARWDDTYAFAQTVSQQYIRDNFTATSLSNLDINAVVVVSTTQQVAYSTAFDSANQTVIALPQTLLQEISSSPSLLSHGLLDSTVKGFISQPTAPMLVVSRPILKSDGSGPANGAFIFGRYFTSEDIRQISDLGLKDLKVYRVADEALKEELGVDTTLLTVENPILVKAMNTETVSGFALINDIKGFPSLVLRVDNDRAIYRQGIASLQTLFLWLLGGGFLISLFSIPLTDVLVMRQIQKLSHGAAEIRSRGDLSLRIPVEGKDELARLSFVINDLLAALEQQGRELSGSRSAERRANQVQTLMSIINQLNSLTDPNEIIQQAVELLGNRFNLYYTGLFLLDESKLFAVLRASSLPSVEAGIRLAVGGASSVGQSIAKNTPQVIELGERRDQFNFTRLPLARSEIAVPLKAGNRILGALVLQSNLPNAFDDPRQVEVLEAAADSLGGLISTAQQVRDLLKQFQESEQSRREFLAEGWKVELQQQAALEYTFENPDMPTLRQNHSTLEAPICLHGLVLGQVRLESDKIEWSAEERAFLDAILEQAARSLENARQFEQSNRRAAQERLVANITRLLRASGDVDGILKSATLELGRSLQAASAEIQINPRADDILVQSARPAVEGDEG